MGQEGSRKSRRGWRCWTSSSFREIQLLVCTRWEVFGQQMFPWLGCWEQLWARGNNDAWRTFQTFSNLPPQMCSSRVRVTGRLFTSFLPVGSLSSEFSLCPTQQAPFSPPVQDESDPFASTICGYAPYNHSMKIWYNKQRCHHMKWNKTWNIWLFQQNRFDQQQQQQKLSMCGAVSQIQKCQANALLPIYIPGFNNIFYFKHQTLGLEQ